MLAKIKNYLRNDVVLSVSLLLALLSCLIEPPSLKYLRYIDFNTLIMLFCLMLIACRNRSQELPDYETVPHFQMTDSAGNPFDSSQLTGKVWAVDFIYKR